MHLGRLHTLPTLGFLGKHQPYNNFGCNFASLKVHRVWGSIFGLGGLIIGLKSAPLPNRATVHCGNFERSESGDNEAIDKIYKKFFPVSDPNNKINEKDVLRIGRSLVGMCVCSFDEAVLGPEKGLTGKNSVNVSFASGRDPGSLTVVSLLDDRLRNGEDCAKEIREYENRLRSLIEALVSMQNDHRDSDYPEVYLMVVGDTQKPSECNKFFGLGRLGPSDIPPNRVFLLSQPPSGYFKMPESALSLKASDIYALRKKRLVDWYLSMFIEFIRTEFDPNQFVPSYDPHHIEKCSFEKDPVSCLENLRSTQATKRRSP